MNKAVAFLQEAGVFYLATLADKRPSLRPFGFVMEHEGRIYFCTGTHKAVYTQLMNNPSFEIGAHKPDGTWLRLQGKAVFDQSPDLVEAAFTAAPSLRARYSGEMVDKFILFYAEEAQAQLLDLAGNVTTL